MDDGGRGKKAPSKGLSRAFDVDTEWGVVTVRAEPVARRFSSVNLIEEIGVDDVQTRFAGLDARCLRV